MVATNTASDLELCASTYRHFSQAGFSSEIFIVENNSRVIQKTNNKRIEKIKREDILRENFQIYGICTSDCRLEKPSSAICSGPPELLLVSERSGRVRFVIRKKVVAGKRSTVLAPDGGSGQRIEREVCEPSII